MSQNQQTQTGKILDLLSEGPIAGIVGGAAGVYLDGTPIIDSEDKEIYGRVPGTVTYSGGTTVTFTPDTGFDLTNLELEEGSRSLVIYEGGGFISNGQVKETNKTLLTTPGNTWTESDIGRFVLIEDGVNGAVELFSIERVGSPSDARVVLNAESQGPYDTDRGVYFSETKKITQVNSSTSIEIDSAFTDTSLSGSRAIITASSRSLDGENSRNNFESVRTSFVNGEREQNAREGLFGDGSTAFASNINEEIRQTTRSGTYSIAGQDSRVYSASTTLGISAPENIDRVKINIRFPSLIIYQQDGDQNPAGVEFQIFFEIRRGNTWFNAVDLLPANSGSATPVFGHSDNAIQYLENPAGSSQLRKYFNFDDGDQTSDRVTKWALASGNNNNGTVKANSKTEFVSEFVIDSTKYKPFSDFRIRIKRVTGVNIGSKNESQCQSQSYMQGIFCYSNDILNYAHSAIAGVTFNSTDFNNFPQRAYLARGMLLQVPTNYFTREENGAAASYTRNVSTGLDTGSEVKWDGKFRGDIADTTWRTNKRHPNYGAVYCNNPAWVYYDIMVNNRYGLGEFVRAQDINKYDLYRIARYCDELVPDGKGGEEPRFTCNLYLQSRTEAFKVINDIASVFRSIVKWTNGEISASQDAPKAPIYTFSNSNVLGGSFAYESTSKRLRINQVAVTWNNPADFYKQDVLTVEDSEAIIEDGKIIKKDTVAVGCTSEGQATRLGKWMLLTERLETDLVKFQTGINGAYLRPGDIFYVQDYNRTNSIASGRLAQSNNHTTSTIYFDRSIPFSAATYDIHLAFPQGAAYLQQDEATIDGIDYAQGDLVPEAYLADAPAVLVSIDSADDASNAVDSNGDFVQLYWSENISVESKKYTSPGGNFNSITLDVGEAFSSVPNSEVMFTITNIDNSNTALGAIAYRVLNIAESDEKTIDISGHIYLGEKFAAIDRGYVLTVPEFTPLPTFDKQKVPSPENVNVNITRVEPVPDVNRPSAPSLYQYIANITWGAPKETGSQEIYQYIDYYEIRHPYTPTRGYEIVRGTKATELVITSFVDLAPADIYVRTVNILGRKSPWAIYSSGELSDTPSTVIQTPTFVGVPSGGSLDTSVSTNIVSGTITFEDSSFSVIGPRGVNYRVSGITDLVQGSPQVASGEYYYILFDSSANDFKLLTRETDTVAEDPANGTSPPLNYEYWVEYGQPDFTSVGNTTQAIDITDSTVASPGRALFTNTFTVDFDPTAEFSFGDVIKLGSGATAWYGKVLTTSTSPSTITTVEFINKAFASSTSVSKLVFSVDSASDFIVGRVLNNAGSYVQELFSSTRGGQGLVPETVKLEANTLITKYDGDGALLNASPANNITLTAIPGGGLGIEGETPFYRFLEITASPDVLKRDWSASPAYTIPEADLPSEGTTLQYRVEATDDGSPYTSEASDVVILNTVSEGKDAETVKLTASSYVAKYDGTGALINGSPANNITLTATPSSGLGPTIYYRFLETTSSPDVVKQNWSTTNTYTLAEADLPLEGTVVDYKVEATDGVSPFSAEASDTITITALSDGAAGSPGPDGRPGIPAATNILFYNDLEGSAPTNAGDYAFYDTVGAAYRTSWSDLTSNVNRIEIHDQDQGSTDRTSYYEQVVAGDIITYFISSGQWVEYLVTSVSDQSAFYRFEVSLVEFDQSDSSADPTGSPGTQREIRISRASEPITGFLDNESHEEAADQDGNLLDASPALGDAGGLFSVFKGVENVTTSASFTVSAPATVDGLLMQINPSTGVYTLSGTWTGVSAVFELKATYANVTVSKQYVIAKVLAGAAAVTGFLTNDSHLEASTNSGQLLDNLSDAGGTLKVFDGVVDVTTGSGVSYSVVGGSGSPNNTVTSGGLQMSINTSTGVYSLSENSDWTSNREVFTLQAIYDAHSPSTTIQKTYTIAKSISGADGAPGSPGPAGSPGTPGVDAYTVVADPEFYSFLADFTGDVKSVAGFAGEFGVKKGTQAYTYDNSVPYAANTYRYSSVVDTNVSSSVSGTGVITIDLNTGSMMSGTATTTGKITVTIIDNADSSTIAVKDINFSKVLDAARDGGTFTFRAPDSTFISQSEAIDWADASALSSATASSVAQEVVGTSVDGYVRPNDRVTVYDDTASPAVAGTRIYVGTATNSGLGATDADWSSLVVEVFDGSVIVEDTLSANRLAANSTFTNNLIVGSIFDLGAGGKIKTEGLSWADANTGIFLGENSNTGSPYQKFRVGDPNGQELRFDGSTGEASITGSLTIRTPFGDDVTLSSDNTVNFDDPTALAWNSQFTEWSSPALLPVGWTAPGSNTDGFSQETTIALSGGSSLKWSQTAATNTTGRYITRSHDSADLTGNHAAPDIPMNFPSDTSVEFSCDVYVASASGSGNVGILLDLVTNYTASSPFQASFFRGVANADLTITNQWQRVWGRVSQTDSESQFNGPVVGNDIIALRGVIVVSVGRGGTFYFDNFRFTAQYSGTDNGNTINSSGNIAGDIVMDQGSIAVGKTSAASTTKGFWLGYDGSSDYDFHIGDASEFLRWDGSAGTLNVEGTLTIGGGSTLTEANTLNDNRITSGNSGGAINRNGDFSEAVLDSNGILRPVGWYRRATGTDLSGFSYADTTNRREFKLEEGGNTLKTMVLSSEAWRHYEGTSYEAFIKFKRINASTSNLARLRWMYLNRNDIGSPPTTVGKKALTPFLSGNFDSEVVLPNGSTSNVNMTANASYTVVDKNAYSGLAYTPPTGATWVGIAIWGVDDVILGPQDIQIEYFYVRSVNTANGSTIDSNGDVAGAITIIGTGSIEVGASANDNIFIDGANKVITIKDSGVIRVKLGDLA
jgi:predicted phage tail protein